MDKNGPNWNEWVIKKWKRSRVRRWFGDGGGSVRQHRDDKENTHLIQGENVQRINKKEKENHQSTDVLENDYHFRKKN